MTISWRVFESNDRILAKNGWGSVYIDERIINQYINISWTYREAIMKKHIVSIILFVSFSVVAYGVERLHVDGFCSYYGDPMEYELYGFESDQEAQEAIEHLMSYTGLPQNFVIMAANVDNAQAAIRGPERLILYSQEFMLRVKDVTNNDWAALSILAHEIGHHLAGHTLLPGGSRPDIELEADRYSGHILHRMGATLEEAKLAMTAFSNNRGSSTHPPKSARLAAITNGWMAAQEISRVQFIPFLNIVSI